MYIAVNTVQKINSNFRVAQTTFKKQKSFIKTHKLMRKRIRKYCLVACVEMELVKERQMWSLVIIYFFRADNSITLHYLFNFMRQKKTN